MNTNTRTSANGPAPKPYLMTYIPMGRVSTQDQSDKGESLTTQIAACKAYIERIGGTATKELTEDISGATTMLERKSGREADTLLRTGRAQGVVFHVPDRFSRKTSRAIIDAERWLEAGYEIHFTDTGKLPSADDIVFLLRSWQASEERKEIRRRTSVNRIEHARNGSAVHGGKTLYGYSKVGEKGSRRYVIKESEAKIVRRIFKLCLKGKTTYEIALLLTADKVPTPLGAIEANKPEHKRKRKLKAHQWNKNTVRNILRDESYAGKHGYRDRQWYFDDEVGTGKIEQSIPAIVDRDTFDKAQAQLGQNKQDAMRNANREYLLKGMATCQCQYSMSGNVCAKSPHLWYYVCTGDRTRVDLEQCGRKTISGAKLECMVWTHAKSLLSDADKLRNELIEAQKSERANVEPQRERMAEIEKKQAELKIEMDNLADSLALLPASSAAAKAVRDALAMREEIAAQFEADRAELAELLSREVFSDEAIQSVLDYAADVREGLEEAENNEELKRTCLKAVGAKAQVLRDKVIIATQFPASLIETSIS